MVLRQPLCLWSPVSNVFNEPSISYKKTSNPADIKETVVSGQCPNSTWIRLGNKCYFVKRQEADLYENIVLCNQLNASLISITSEGQNLQGNRLISPGESIWLGLGLKSNHSQEFRWFDGSPFAYNSWRNKPNVTYKYFGAYFVRDLKWKASPRKTHIPAEFRGHCPDTIWRRVVSKCIYLNLKKSMTYMKNQALCKELNATMVSIHSEAENIHLSTLSRSFPFWIGFKQISRKDRLYEWEDGSPKTYENWAENNPYRLGKKYWAAYSSRGVWRDTEGFYQMYPVCQTTLLTHAQDTSSYTNNQISFSAISLGAASAKTKSPSDYVTTAITELPSTASTYDETITAAEPGKTATVTEDSRKTDFSFVSKNAVQLLNDVKGKLAELEVKNDKSKHSRNQTPS